MKAKVEAAQHWRLLAHHNALRALQAEERALQQQYAQVAADKQKAQTAWGAALEEIGKAVGVQGNPDTWTVRLGESPEDTIIESPDKERAK